MTIPSDQNPMSSIQSFEATNLTCSGKDFRSPFGVALIEAVVAGVIASLLFYIMNGTENRYETAGTLLTKIWLPTLSSYILLALSYKTRWLVASIPSWLFIPTAGTALALVVQKLPNVIIGWNHPLQHIPFSDWCKAATVVWMLFNLMLVPVTLILHYGRRIIQNLTR